MEYTDEELLNWWGSLTKSDQRFLIEKMVEQMEHSSFAKSLMNMYDSKLRFSPKQIAAIRKWDS